MEGCTAESEQRLNQNKDKCSQSKEKGDPLPQEAAARGTGDRNFCRSGKIMLLPNAECRKKETKIPLSDNCMRPHASRTPQDQFREWQDWLEITREGGRHGGRGKQSHLQNHFVTIAAPLEGLVWYSLVPLPQLPIGIWVRSKSLPQPLSPAHLPSLTNTSVACHLPDPPQSLKRS